MFRFLPALGLAPVLALAGTGCMAAMNMRDGPDPKFELVNKVPPRSIYGGARLDALVCLEFPDVVRKDPVEGMVDVPFVLLFLADLPPSAVVDTLTLPVTVPASLKRWADERSQANPDSSAERKRPDER